MQEKEKGQSGTSRRAQDERGAFLPGRVLSDAWHTLLTLVALVAMAPVQAGVPAASTPTAQTTSSVPASETPKGAEEKSCANPTAADAPLVTEVYRPEAIRKPVSSTGSGAIEYSHRQDAGLRDTIALKVLHIDSLLRWQECTARLGVKKKIVLYLNGRPLPDVVAEPPLDPATGVVMFPLKRSERSREVWAELLGKPTSATRTVEVSLGLEDQFAIQSSAELQLTVLPPGPFRLWLVIFFVLIFGFVLLASSSDLLRDGDAPLVEGTKKPWSLARVQGAWWFFLVLASYLLIGLVTGDYSSSITGTSLVLLGIAAGTTISSVLVDISKDTSGNAAKEKAARARICAELGVLEGEIAKFNATTADANKAAENQNRVEELTNKQSQLHKLTRESEGFFKDVLSDANGVSLHRFQIAAWTLVLGIVFVMQVFRDLSMPQFDDTLLGLMGLSAATFVAMKTTEPVVPKP